jgi:hypothetical protein
MANTKAIVTLAVGERYLQAWKRDCEPNWRQYAAKHGYDLLCISEPLDTSERAQKRMPSWQKLLILSQDFSPRYERIVWVDSDILINYRLAPSIVDGVPADKVGAAEMFCFSKAAGATAQQSLKRMFDFWKEAVVNPTAEEYYVQYGLPNGFDAVVQTGVMVLSPAHHRSLFEKVYYEYEEKGGPEWNYEMRPLSYEIVKAGLAHWIDPRFNLLWLDCAFLHYPFLLSKPASRNLVAKLFSKVGRRLGVLSPQEVRKACLNIAFLNSYFFHLGGSEIRDMQAVNTSIGSWLDCSI